MKESHRQIAEDLFNKVSMAMTELGKSVPIFVLILPDDSVFPVVIQGGEYNVQEYAAIVNDVASQMGAAAMMLVAEQMMVSKTSDDADLQALLNGTMRPSEHPDSKPYLTLMYLDDQGTCESIIAEIDRDPIGTPFTREHKWISEAVTNIIQPWN